MTTLDRIGSAFLRAILLRMKELGLNNTALAKRMNVSRPYITKVLSGDVNFSFRTAAKLANALQMDFIPELRPCEAEEIQLASDLSTDAFRAKLLELKNV